MSEMLWIGVAAFAQLSAAGAVLALARARKRGPGPAVAAWMLLLPVLGPATGCMLLFSGEPGPGGQRAREAKRSAPGFAPPPKQAVPVEEALILNDPKRRREQMMNMLRTDPRKFLDVLLVARFNEDPETAHYATAALMVLQREMLVELHRCQSAVEKNPSDEKSWAEYARLLEQYCESGLVEGQLLLRRRLLMAAALEKCLQTPETLRMAVNNHLLLGQGRQARAAAREMLDRWPLDERSWLEMMRVCAATRDARGMGALMKSVRSAKVDWTFGGREKIRYWMGQSS